MKIFDIYRLDNHEFNLPFYEFDNMDRIAIKKLCSFVKSPKTTTTEVEFHSPVFYRVQRPFLQNATFNIESMFGEPIPAIKNVYLQLITESPRMIE